MQQGFYNQDFYDPYGRSLFNMMGLLNMAEQRRRQKEQEFNALPQEEQELIIAEREAEKKAEEERKEQKRITACIQQGLCPDCLGKLIRGKKDKKNGYKRTWRCIRCNKDIIY